MHARRLLLLTSLGLLGLLVVSEASDKDTPHAVPGATAPAQLVPVMDGLNIPYKEYATSVRSRRM